MGVLLIPTSCLLISNDERLPMHPPSVLDLLEGRRVDDRPLEVEPVHGTPYFVIRNGRHRFLAAVLAALPLVRCVLADGGGGTP